MAAQPDPTLHDPQNRVREAAFRLFGRFGYDGVSMTTVARQAELTKAGLYWHYRNKEALYADCMRELVGVFEVHLFAAAAAHDDPIEQIFALFAGMERLVDDPRVKDGIAGYWLKPRGVEISEARAVQEEFDTTAESLIKAILDDARQSRSLSVEGSVRDMSRAFIALMEAIVLPLGKRSADDHRRVVRVLAHIFFQAHSRAPEITERAARLIETTEPV